MAVNGQFQKRKYRLVTFYGPRGRHEADLDHIVARRKWCSSFLDCEAKQVHNVKSDYAAAVVKCCWHQVTKKTKVTRCTLRNWDRLHTNHECHADVISHIKGSCRVDRWKSEVLTIFIMPLELQLHLFLPCQLGRG